MKHYCNINSDCNADTLTKERREELHTRGGPLSGFHDYGFHVEQEDDGPLTIVHITDDEWYSERAEIKYCPKCGYHDKTRKK